MLAFVNALPYIVKGLESEMVSRRRVNVAVCAAKGPRPRYPRVWKDRKVIGTVSKSAKLVECVKGLSNIKEEVYGALDSFIAWDLEFPLIVVKKALKTLEYEKEWKRTVQLTKWMLSKGQGRTLGTYFTLINALVEDERLEEAEEVWLKVFTENLESTPRNFFEKMAAVYYNRGMHEKLFELFADMDELGITPTVPVVRMVGNVFQELGMMDKYQKLTKKYPPPKWEFRYFKGKRVKVRVKHADEFYRVNQATLAETSTGESSVDLDEPDTANEGIDRMDMETDKDEPVNENSSRTHEEACEDDNTMDAIDIEDSSDGRVSQNPSELYNEAER